MCSHCKGRKSNRQLSLMHEQHISYLEKYHLIDRRHDFRHRYTTVDLLTDVIQFDEVAVEIHCVPDLANMYEVTELVKLGKIWKI